MKVTQCPPGKASGQYLEHVIFFLRCGFPHSTARKLAGMYYEVLDMSDEAWALLKTYTMKQDDKSIS